MRGLGLFIVCRGGRGIYEYVWFLGGIGILYDRETRRGETVNLRILCIGFSTANVFGLCVFCLTLSES